MYSCIRCGGELGKFNLIYSTQLHPCVCKVCGAEYVASAHAMNIVYSIVGLFFGATVVGFYLLGMALLICFVFGAVSAFLELS